MRMVEIRERYARRVPGRGMALLIWQADATTPTGQEALYPTLAQAQRTACTYLQDPRCTGVWVYDGRRLYDRAALTLWAQEAGALSPRLSDQGRRGCSPGGCGGGPPGAAR